MMFGHYPATSEFLLTIGGIIAFSLCSPHCVLQERDICRAQGFCSEVARAGNVSYRVGTKTDFSGCIRNPSFVNSVAVSKTF